MKPRRNEHSALASTSTSRSAWISPIAGRTDAIGDTLDYSRAFALVRAVVEDEQFSLIEAIAARIADIVLAEPRVGSVRVRVGKQPPIAGAIDRCSVIIERFATTAGVQE